MVFKLTVKKGEQVVEVSAGDFAVDRFNSRALVVDGKGSLQIDGVRIEAGEIPSVMDKVRRAADHEAERAHLKGATEVISLSNVEEEVFGLPIAHPRKNIKIFQDVARNEIV